MRRKILAAASAVLSIPLICSGMVMAQQQVVCTPVCAPTHSNSPGNATSDSHRGQGLRNANEHAGDHGFHGRDNARVKQDLHKPGGSGVPDPTPVPTPVPPPPVTEPPPSGSGCTGTLC